MERDGQDVLLYYLSVPFSEGAENPLKIKN